MILKRIYKKIITVCLYADFSRILRNVAFNGVEHVILIIMWLVSTPIFISHLGNQLFGILTLANSLIAMGAVFNFGLRESAIRSVAKYCALNQQSEVYKAVQTTLILYTVSGVLTAALVYYSTPFFVAHIFNVQAQNIDTAIIVLRLSGLILAIAAVDQVFEAVLNGFHRLDMSSRANIACRLFVMVLNIIWLLNGYGIIIVLITMACGYVIQAILKWKLVKKHFMKASIYPIISVKHSSELLSFGIHIWFQSISGALINNADRFIIVSLMDTTAVGIYGVCIQIGSQIHLLIIKLLSFVFPATSALKEQGKIDVLRQFYINGLRFTTIITSAIFLPVFLLAPDLLRFWLSPDFSLQATSCLKLLLIFYTFNSNSIIPYYIFNGTGNTHWNTIIGPVSGVIVILGSILLIPIFGLFGAPWAKLLTLFSVYFMFYIIDSRIISGSFWHASLLCTLSIVSMLGIATLLETYTAGLINNIGELIGYSALLSIAGVSSTLLAIGLLYLNKH